MPSDVPHAWWRELNSARDTAGAVHGAAADLERAIAGLGPRNAPLTASIAVVPVIAELPQSVTVTVSGARTVQLSLEVIRRAAAFGMRPLALIACALAEREALDERWRPKRVGTGQPPSESLIRQHRLIVRATSTTRDLDRFLDAGVDCVVCGDQGSGASEQVSAWAAARAESQDRGLVWLSPSDPADGAESIYETMLAMEQSVGYLVVVDGVQSNPHTLKRIRRCVADLRDAYGLKVVFVATAWPSLVARMPDPFKGLRQIRADGAELVRLLLNEVSAEDRPAFYQLVGPNVHLASTALSLYSEERRVPDRRRLQVAVTGATEEETHQAALYWFACLTVLEIDVPRKLAVARFAAHTIDDLERRKLLWLSDGCYTIGPRARAGLVLERALAEWNAANRWGRPAQIVWDYLNSAGEATIIAMLERMDLVGLIDDPSVSDGTKYLAMAWDQRARLVRALADHYLKQGTWNDCIGAAVFSAQVFAETKDSAAWHAVATYVRGRFAYDAPALPTAVGDQTSDFADFPAIRSAMAKEDHEQGPPTVPGWETARDIEVERFYLNWVLGLLLVFEGSALDHDADRVDRLLAIAEAQQDQRAGFFYPMRVPWVTARIVLGLCQAGQTYQTSAVVRRACDWLRRHVSNAGALDTWWRSGTGQWNTDEATTAMCLTALHRAGAPTTNGATDTQLAWLLDRRAQWQRENHEVDLALVVEALLLHQAGGVDLQQDVLALLQWALGVPENGLPAVDSAIPEDNLRLPFVAAQLTVVIWATMMRELAAVIDDEMRPYLPAEPAGQVADNSTLVPLNDAAIAAWHRSIDITREILAARIDRRERSKGADAVANRLADLRAQLGRLNELSAQVAAHTPRAVLAELDALGRQVCGDRWPFPPSPE